MRIHGRPQTLQFAKQIKKCDNSCLSSLFNGLSRLALFPQNKTLISSQKDVIPTDRQIGWQEAQVTYSFVACVGKSNQSKAYQRK